MKEIDLSLALSLFLVIRGSLTLLNYDSIFRALVGQHNRKRTLSSFKGSHSTGASYNLLRLKGLPRIIFGQPRRASIIRCRPGQVTKNFGAFKSYVMTFCCWHWELWYLSLFERLSYHHSGCRFSILFIKCNSSPLKEDTGRM